MAKAYILQRTEDDCCSTESINICCYADEHMAKQEQVKLNEELKQLRQYWKKIDAHMKEWYSKIPHPAFYGYWNDRLRYSGYDHAAFLAELNSFLDTLHVPQALRIRLMPTQRAKHIDDWAFNDAVKYKVLALDYISK